MYCLFSSGTRKKAIGFHKDKQAARERERRRHTHTRALACIRHKIYINRLVLAWLATTFVRLCVVRRAGR